MRPDKHTKAAFPPWGWAVAWTVAGELAALLIGGVLGAVLAACFAVSGVVLGVVLWRATRPADTPPETYVADHPPLLVFRANPPIGTPRWYSRFFPPPPSVLLEGPDNRWALRSLRWRKTYAVDAPPGTYQLEISTTRSGGAPLTRNAS